MQESPLFQKDIFRKLKYGVPPGSSHLEVFYAVVGDEIERICAYFGCSPRLSEVNLLRAQEYWIEDIEALPIGEGSEPDHFKHAGWLCHWIRKKQPIVRLDIHDEGKMEPWFEAAYNEICAFIVGLKLVIFHECCEHGHDDATIIRIAKEGVYHDMLADIGLYLDHKNVSPHAIYLIYKAAMHTSPLDRA